jgi:poly(hydroxyalkanoate) depolymerase family esterase
MTTPLQNAMTGAMQLTRAGRLMDATQLIQRALSGGQSAAAPVQARQAPAATAYAEPIILDGCVFEVPSVAAKPSARAAATDLKGSFTDASHTHGGLTRQYKLFTPPQATLASAGKPLPLVVMLHGCTQNPDDFAAGTGMNLLAAAHGCYVLYPAQAKDANPSACWNWFKHSHQRRGSGEPALIASLVQRVAKQEPIDAKRVFIAGLSAGGAMAAIVATRYPELFAAVGVHSGLACGAASDLMQAIAAMKSGQATPKVPCPVPTIVFHGDSDATVHAANGAQVIDATLIGHGAHSTSVQHGASKRGQRYTRTAYTGSDGAVLAEHWLLHGAGHAWSGGNASGSYTDARGVDASVEMLRFFQAVVDEKA